MCMICSAITGAGSLAPAVYSFVPAARRWRPTADSENGKVAYEQDRGSCAFRRPPSSAVRRPPRQRRFATTSISGSGDDFLGSALELLSYLGRGPWSEVRGVFLWSCCDGSMGCMLCRSCGQHSQSVARPVVTCEFNERRARCGSTPSRRGGTLPTDFPAPLVIAQHLGPNSRAISRILRRQGPLPVRTMADGARAVGPRRRVCGTRRSQCGDHRPPGHLQADSTPGARHAKPSINLLLSMRRARTASASSR